jgi:hypothetical protein
MFARQWNRRSVRLFVFAALALLGLLAAQPLAAADLSSLDTSLKLIPADAAFYSTMLRNREQFEAVKNSKAWAKIRAMPIVQFGFSAYEMQVQSPGTVPAKIEEVLNNPEIRKIIDLAIDMSSDEIFVYGDKSFVDCLELAQEAVSAMRYGPAVMQLTGKSNGKPQDMQAAAVISALADDVKLIALPNLVVGFKVKNVDLAKEQLIKLEAIANVLLDLNDKTKGHFKKTKVADQECLVLELDGSMIPWDEIPLDELKEKEAEEGDVQKIVDRIKQSKLVITLGIRGNYVIATIGSSTAPLEKLGKGEHLIDRAEFKPLAKFVDKRLVSIGYISEALNQQLNRQQKDIDELLEVVNQVVPEAPGLNDEQKERIRKDAKALADDLKTLVPKAGAMMGLSYLSDHGIEGYQYSWGDYQALDGSQPLGLLEHVGGNPLLGVVARQKADVKKYDVFVKWAKVGYAYFKEFALPRIPEKDRKKAEKFLEAAIPLVERLDKANREMLLPALADGQLAFVIDGKLASSHFVAAAPATEKPMPMIEPAFVLGVSNADLLKKGLGEYRQVVNGLIDAVRQTGAEIPENIAIPDPQVTDSAGGKVYSFPLPEAWGVDKKIAPNFGLGEKVAVLSLTQDQTNRLLTATPLGVGGLLDKSDRPLAAAAWFRWAGLLDAAGPWVDFAVDQAVANNGPPDEAGKKALADQVRIQVSTVTDVLKALKTVTNESYLEDGVLVNHTLVEIHDLEK